jgi:hypothetical protein
MKQETLFHYLKVAVDAVDTVCEFSQSNVRMRFKLLIVTICMFPYIAGAQQWNGGSSEQSMRPNHPTIESGVTGLNKHPRSEEEQEFIAQIQNGKPRNQSEYQFDEIFVRPSHNTALSWSDLSAGSKNNDTKVRTSVDQRWVSESPHTESERRAYLYRSFQKVLQPGNSGRYGYDYTYQNGHGYLNIPGNVSPIFPNAVPGMDIPFVDPNVGTSRRGYAIW